MADRDADCGSGSGARRGAGGRRSGAGRGRGGAYGRSTSSRIDTGTRRLCRQDGQRTVPPPAARVDHTCPQLPQASRTAGRVSPTGTGIGVPHPPSSAGQRVVFPLCVVVTVRPHSGHSTSIRNGSDSAALLPYMAPLFAENVCSVIFPRVTMHHHDAQRSANAYQVPARAAGVTQRRIRPVAVHRGVWTRRSTVHRSRVAVLRVADAHPSQMPRSVASQCDGGRVALLRRICNPVRRRASTERDRAAASVPMRNRRRARFARVRCASRRRCRACALRAHVPRAGTALYALERVPCHPVMSVSAERICGDSPRENTENPRTHARPGMV